MTQYRFLRGCGVPDNLIEQLPTLIQEMDPSQFCSCFISYSHKDEEFAQCLQIHMQQAGLLVWYASEDMKGGRKIHEQLFNAIGHYDRLLLVLSESSMSSQWVATEIRRARKRELEEDVECEDILYVASRAYEIVTDGQDMPQEQLKYPELGEGWDFDDDEEMRARYPKLFAKFGEV